jgi:hypothetical protein
MDTNWKSRVWNSSSISLDKCASLALALLLFFFCECHRHKTQVWKKIGEQNERSWHVKRSCQMNNMIDFQCFCPTWWFWWFTTSLMERNYLRAFSSTSFSISWGSSTRDCSQRKPRKESFHIIPWQVWNEEKAESWRRCHNFVIFYVNCFSAKFLHKECSLLKDTTCLIYFYFVCCPHYVN